MSDTRVERSWLSLLPYPFWIKDFGFWITFECVTLDFVAAVATPPLRGAQMTFECVTSSVASGLFQLEQLVAVEPSHSPVVEGHGVDPGVDARYLSRECPLFLESYASA